MAKSFEAVMVEKPVLAGYFLLAGWRCGLRRKEGDQLLRAAAKIAASAKALPIIMLAS